MSLYRRVRIDVGVGSEERDGYDTATHNNERLIRFERTKLRDRERKREEERQERDKCASFFVFAQLWKRSSEEVLEGSRAPAGNGGEYLANLLPERRSYVRTLIRLRRTRGKRSVEHRAVIDDNTRVAPNREGEDVLSQNVCCHSTIFYMYMYHFRRERTRKYRHRQSSLSVRARLFSSVPSRKQ